jgi:hypothetical protein
VHIVEWSGDKGSPIGVQFNKPVNHVCWYFKSSPCQELEVAMNRIERSSNIPENDELRLLSDIYSLDFVDDIEQGHLYPII